MDTTPPTEMNQQNTERERRITQSLKLLRNGFKTELEEFIYSDQRFTEVLMDLCSEFVEQNIPLVEEEHQHDLALLMLEGLTIKSY